MGWKDKNKHQLKIKFVSVRRWRQNKQFILCMPPGHNEFKQRHTKELYTIPPTSILTHTLFSHCMVSCPYAGSVSYYEPESLKFQ